LVFAAPHLRFWYLLRRICAECGTTVTKLIEAIDIARDRERSLCSEIRVCVAAYFARQVPQTGFHDPASRFAFRFEPGIRLDRPSKALDGKTRKAGIRLDRPSKALDGKTRKARHRQGQKAA
jgi:predicted DNA-binding ribbon-helix-helix protein